MIYYAHSVPGRPETDQEPLPDHLSCRRDVLKALEQTYGEHTVDGEPYVPLSRLQEPAARE
ncbi:hypothetical protein [Methylorubrum suomiense]|uniref:Uncharacterized protein n=1 Tax=Methylorubrum suomiense TaxID=144191 RepID=A0ABQ4V3Y7_9HYPH|nr:MULTISPECIES: hypothetical protein [Methylobacteriaceae]GJE78234.1 hypothetical protein BGCPKDLD_4848 [Methylorubrum suomiense]